MKDYPLILDMSGCLCFFELIEVVELIELKDLVQDFLASKPPVAQRAGGILIPCRD